MLYLNYSREALTKLCNYFCFGRNVWRSSTSHGGDLRQLLNRGINWIEESLSPPHCILYSFYYESFCKFHLRYFQRYREPYCDLRRVSWNNGKKEPAAIPRRSTLSSGREAFQPDWYDTIMKISSFLLLHSWDLIYRYQYHNSQYWTNFSKSWLLPELKSIHVWKIWCNDIWWNIRIINIICFLILLFIY